DRDPVTNQITRIEDFYTNIDDATTRGVDTELSYRFEPNFFDSQVESLSLRMLVGYLAERSETPDGGVTTDFAGSGNTPEWSTTTTLNYGVGPWSLALSHRFIDSVTRNVNWVEGVDVDINKLEAVRWMNMRMSYTHEAAGGSTYQLFGNITNLLGDSP